MTWGLQVTQGGGASSDDVLVSATFIVQLTVSSPGVAGGGGQSD